MTYDITTGVQTATATGAVTGVLSTSAMSGQFTIFVDICGLGIGQTATVAIQDTASSTPFSDANTVASFNVAGQITSQADVMQSRLSFESPAVRFGAANTALRANVTALSGGTITLHAFLEQ
jgi:hypothetical protein